LRGRIKAVLALIEQKKYGEIAKEYMDPFWLARASASERIRSPPSKESSVDGLVDRMAKMNYFGSARFLKVLRRSLEAEPSWLLDGRAASFMEQAGSSHTAEFWVYFEGKWRISPET